MCSTPCAQAGSTDRQARAAPARSKARRRAAARPVNSGSAFFKQGIKKAIFRARFVCVRIFTAFFSRIPAGRQRGQQVARRGQRQRVRVGGAKVIGLLLPLGAEHRAGGIQQPPARAQQRPQRRQQPALRSRQRGKVRRTPRTNGTLCTRSSMLFKNRGQPVTG